MMPSFIRDCRMGCQRVRGPSHPASRTTSGPVFRRSVLAPPSRATGARQAERGVRRTRSPSFGDTGRSVSGPAWQPSFLHSRGIVSSRGLRSKMLAGSFRDPALEDDRSSGSAHRGRGFSRSKRSTWVSRLRPRSCDGGAGPRQLLCKTRKQICPSPCPGPSRRTTGPGGSSLLML